jgi:hypothetical protein
MAKQPPQGPSDMFRTTTMASAVMMAHDRERAHNDLDERERDRIAQETIEAEHQEYLRSQRQSSRMRRILNRLLPT